MIKKTLYISFLVLCCAACGSNNSNNTSATTDSNTTSSTGNNTSTAGADASDASGGTKNGISRDDYEKGLALVAKSDCLTCHKVDTKLVGPAYKDVAKKYPNNDATIDSLSNKVIHGGSGNWGQVAMTPHPTLSKDDAKQMVKYVLYLK